MQRKGYLGQVETIFNAGDRVIINEGIYKDIEAIYQKNDGLERAVLMLNLLQKDVELTIKLDTYEKYSLKLHLIKHPFIKSLIKSQRGYNSYKIK